MANGPPTPPPTTEAEIQDEARSAAETAVAISALPQSTRDDAYQAVFPAIADLASQSKFPELIELAEVTELNSDADSDRRTTRLLVVAPLVLSYLIIDNLPPARFALSRLPENVLLGSLSKALLELLASTSERSHANVYSRTQTLYNLIHKPGFFDATLTSVLTGLLEKFIHAFRQRTVILLAKAYTSLPLPLAQVYLGLTRDELLAATQSAQWTYVSSAEILLPKVHSYVASQTAGPVFSSLSTFHFVANSVAKLEL